MHAQEASRNGSVEKQGEKPKGQPGAAASAVSLQRHTYTAIAIGHLSCSRRPPETQRQGQGNEREKSAQILREPLFLATVSGHWPMAVAVDLGRPVTAGVTSTQFAPVCLCVLGWQRILRSVAECDRVASVVAHKPNRRRPSCCLFHCCVLQAKTQRTPQLGFFLNELGSDRTLRERARLTRPSDSCRHDSALNACFDPSEGVAMKSLHKVDGRGSPTRGKAETARISYSASMVHVFPISNPISNCQVTLGYVKKEHLLIGSF